MQDIPLAAGRVRSDKEIEDEIGQETARHKILVYGKGTREEPMCGFTVETREFFEQFGYPFEILDVLADPAKREVLTRMTDWPTLPKVFIGGTFHGDTDVLGPMHAKGELVPLLQQVFKD